MRDRSEPRQSKPASSDELTLPSRPKRKQNLYEPGISTDHRLSRSKIDLFMSCSRCFYLEQRHSLPRLDSYPMTLAIAVDELMKKEYDFYRTIQSPHPLMVKAGVNAIPYAHQDLDAWRDSLRRGISYKVPNTPLVITGGIDDVWINTEGKLHIVDYKSTAKKGEVSIDADWQITYKRQVEIYQWLFRNNGFDVSDIAYFVYANGDKSRPNFNNTMHFSTTIIPYEGNASWVDATIENILETLNSPEFPDSNPSCSRCAYYMDRASVENWAAQETPGIPSN